jgi:PAS domain S-box-containing protein
MATKASTTQSKTVGTSPKASLGKGFDEESYRKLMERSPMPTAVHIKGILAYANKAALRLVGARNKGQVVGRSVMDFLHPDSQDIVRKRITLLYERKRENTDTIEEKFIRLDGSIIYVEITSMILVYNGEMAIQVLMRDISERINTQAALKRAQAEAEAERRKLRNFIMQAPAIIAVFRGKNFIVELANPLFTGLTGRISVGRPLLESLPELKDQSILKSLEHVYRTGQPAVENETPIAEIDSPGEKLNLRYFNHVIQPYRNSEGKIEGVMSLAVEVTDQVHGRQELEYSNNLLETITNNASFGMFMVDKEHGLTFMNKAAEEMTGFTFKELKGKNLHEYIHYKRPDGSKYPVKECPIYCALELGKIQKGEDHYIRKNGSFFPMRFTASPIHQSGIARGTVIEIQDLTEEREAQRALRESEENFRQLADSMPQIVWTARPDGYIDYRNQQWYDYTGLPRDQTDFNALTQFLHPDDREKASSSYYAAISSGLPYQVEYRLRDKKQKNKYRWFLGRAVPVRDAKGEIIRWFGTSTDIDSIKRTAHRKKELEGITAALTQQRRELVALNRAKDEFISLASHQLRTPATGTKQFLGMVLEGYVGDLTPDLRRFLERAYESNERQITIVNDLLQVAQIDAGKVVLSKEPVDLVQLIRSVIHEQAARFLAREQTVTFKPHRPTLYAGADQARLRMVLENLIDNASKYTPHGKSIEIKLAKKPHEAIISICDEGVGIPQEDIDKIFRKFSRIENALSAHVGGSGLGLYWARKIIDLHGGTIDVDTEPDKGSTFAITLPL